MKISLRMLQEPELLLDNLEQLLREIDDFNTAAGNNKPADIPQSLENYLNYVAKSGNTIFPWPHVRSLYRAKMMTAIQQFQEPTCPNESFVLERFDLFRTAAPFTVQRLTELILQPTRHYRKKEKFLRGLEKTVLVVSTVEPRTLNNDSEKNGDENNISASSCEEDTENTSVFNRTFPIRQDSISSVRTSAIDTISPSIPITMDSAEGLVLAPVTTSAVSAAVDVITQNIGVAGDVDVIIPDDNVATDSVSAIDVISPDITIAVSSESIILDPVTDVPGTGLVSIETEDDAVAAMECESSSSVEEVSPSTLVQCISEQDLVTTAMHQAATETLSHSESVLESVTSSLDNMDADQLAAVAVVVASAAITDDATNLFSVVTSDPSLVQAADAPISSEPVLVESEVAVQLTDSASTVSADKLEEEEIESSTSNTTEEAEAEPTTEKAPVEKLEPIVAENPPSSSASTTDTVTEEKEQCTKENCELTPEPETEVPSVAVADSTPSEETNKFSTTEKIEEDADVENNVGAAENVGNVTEEATNPDEKSAVEKTE